MASPYLEIITAIASTVDQDKEQFFIKMASVKSTLQSIEKRVALLERIDLGLDQMNELQKSMEAKNQKMQIQTEKIEGIFNSNKVPLMSPASNGED